MKNYIVALDLPKNVGQKIRRAYESIFRKSLAIANLHITIFPPFRPLLPIERLQIPPIQAKPTVLDKPGLFQQSGKKILFLSVSPDQFIKDYCQSLQSLLKNKVDFDLSLYQAGVLPSFHPHISLDYDFDFPESTLIQLKKKLPKESFSLIGPNIYLEEDGDWKKLTSSD